MRHCSFFLIVLLVKNGVLTSSATELKVRVPGSPAVSWSSVGVSFWLLKLSVIAIFCLSIMPWLGDELGVIKLVSRPNNAFGAIIFAFSFLNRPLRSQENLLFSQSLSRGPSPWAPLKFQAGLKSQRKSSLEKVRHDLGLMSLKTDLVEYCQIFATFDIQLIKNFCYLMLVSAPLVWGLIVQSQVYEYSLNFANVTPGARLPFFLNPNYDFFIDPKNYF